MDVQKIESGAFDMDFELIAMSEILERAHDSIRNLAEQRAARVEIPSTKATVEADGARLVQVLENLMSNAIKSSPQGSPVTVAITEQSGLIEVKVIDHGQGIADQFKNLLFQRFQQAETSDDRKNGGTGLGLTICKGIVEAHGGTIGVESEVGKGSVFWFRIPVMQLTQLEQKDAEQALNALEPAQVQLPARKKPEKMIS